MKTGSNAASVSLSTMASAMLFGVIIFATTALTARAIMTGDHIRLLSAASHPRSSALDAKSLTSVYTLLFHSSVFGLILLYAYICEYHPPYPHADKNYDPDLFFFLTFLLFVVSAFTWQRHVPDSKIESYQSRKANGDLVEDMVENSGDSDAEGRNEELVRSVAPPNDKTEVLNRNQTEEWKGKIGVT